MRSLSAGRRGLRPVLAVAGVVFALIGLVDCGGGAHVAAGASGSTTPPTFTSVPGSPFGVMVTPDGAHAFVTLQSNQPNAQFGQVLVYSLAQPTPRLVRTLTVRGEVAGGSITRDGKWLLLANGQGVTVVSVPRALHGAPDPVLGTLTPPSNSGLRADGAIETASSTNGRYVFVSLEYGNPGGAIAVYDLGAAKQPRISSLDYVRAITLGQAVVGEALSPDGRHLYVTSELGARNDSDGTLSVLSVARAERHLPHAVLATVRAERQPVRVAISPDGSIVWVTARASNRLLAFSAAGLLSRRATAPLAEVRVGAAPVGLALFDHGRRVLVADSDRFDARGAHAALTVVNADAALSHRPAVLATLRAGGFPREIAVLPGDRTALVTNFASDQLEVVPLPVTIGS